MYSDGQQDHYCSALPARLQFPSASQAKSQTVTDLAGTDLWQELRISANMVPLYAFQSRMRTLKEPPCVTRLSSLCWYIWLHINGCCIRICVRHVSQYVYPSEPRARGQKWMNLKNSLPPIRLRSRPASVHDSDVCLPRPQPRPTHWRLPSRIHYLGKHSLVQLRLRRHNVWHLVAGPRIPPADATPPKGRASPEDDRDRGALYGTGARVFAIQNIHDGCLAAVAVACV